MNHIYKVIFNKATGTFMAVAEYARGQGKKANRVKSEGVKSVYFTFTALASSFVLMNSAVAAIGDTLPTTVTTDANGTTAFNYCYYDVTSKTVICGDATTTSATGVTGSVILGAGAKSITNNAVAIGNNAISSSPNDISIGNGANAIAGDGVAIGTNAKVNIGTSGVVSAARGIAIGLDSNAQVASSIAMGNGATTTGTGNIANSIAIGTGARTYGTNSIAIGVGTGQNATQPNNVAVGINSGQNVTAGDTVANSGTAVGGSTNVALGVTSGNNVAGNGNLAVGTNAGNRVKVLGASVTLPDGTVQDTGPSSLYCLFPPFYCNGGSGNGGNNTAIGPAAANDVSGAQNIGLGFRAGSFTTGNNNLSIGQLAGFQTNGSGNVGVGSFASSSMIGHQNSAVGNASGSNIIGSYNSTLGVNSGQNVKGESNIGIGNATGQFVSGNENIAIGKNAGKGATGAPIVVNRSVAGGSQAMAYGDDSIAMGTGAIAGIVGANTTQVNAIAIGKGAQATGKQSISVGTQNRVTADNAGAIGDPSIVSGAGSYTLGNDNAVGSTSTNVGAFGNNNQIGATANYDANGKLIALNGLADTAAVENSRAVGNKNYINTSNTYVLGSGVGTKDNGTVLDTVANSVYLGNDSTVAKGAAVGTKNLDKEGVAGTTTTAGDAGTVETATVNGVTYGSFAGKTAAGAVSVGSAGLERRVMNVAAGEISATSTDAINGSQLYATNAKLGNVANTVVENFGGNATLNADGNITYTNIGNTGKDNIHDAIQAATTVVKAGTNVVVDEATNATTGQKEYTVNAWDTTVSAAADSAVTVTPTIDDTNRTRAYEVKVNTDGNTIKVENGQLTANTTPLATTDGKVDAPANADALATAGDIANAINNSGWKATSGATGSGVVDGTTEELINPSETVTFQAGDNMVLNQAENVFTYSLNKDININSVQFNDGPKITNDGDNIKVGDKDGNATKITNVAAGTGDNDAVNVSQLKAVEATANKGWNLTTNGKAESKSNVKPGDTVDFANTDRNVKIENTGNNVTVNLNKDIDLTKDGSVTIGDTKVNNDGLTIVGGPSVTKSGIDAGDKKITKLADGEISATSKDAVNGSQLYTLQQAAVAAKTEVKAGDNVEVKKESGGNGQDIYTVSAKDTSASVTAGSDAITVNKADPKKVGTVDVTDYKVDLSQATKDNIQKGVDAKDIVDNKGLTFAGDNNSSTEVQKLGSTVNVNGDSNITTQASGNTVKVTLNPNVTVESLTATNSVNVGSGGAQVALTTNVGKDGVRELSVGSANAPTRITNVAPGVDATDAVNMNQLKDFGYNLGNKIDKVGDEANAGVSSAMAMAALPQAYIPGKSMATGGMATYNGQGAVAVGISKLSDNGRWVLKISGSADTEGNVGGAVGAGFHF
ncbi:ESPR-type extended signal peptide-containing protein [Francisella tularensis]|uniref:ESPR-type extended signal peptide-containing protein n=1 Tax=Francisella tularensis TaxID=263 RepID=UPI00136679A8|nr:YadA-like family protein [Francisella tularensis]MWY17667.1 hypothetical protein [Francisella tularensis]